jgi:acyl-CoA thioesterase I
MLTRAALLTALLAALLLAACAPGDEEIATPEPDGPSPEPPPQAITPSPAPEPTLEEEPMATYLALGDSLAVGIGASDPERDGYVALIHEALGDEELGLLVGGHRIDALENLAVGGETSASMRDGGQLDEAQERIARADPPVTLVTLDIGGNDLLALIRGEPCASDPDGDACREQVRQTLDAFERNYRLILGTLAETAARQDREVVVAVMTYFNPFSGTEHQYEAAGDLALLGVDARIDCDLAEADPEARGMNDIIACVGVELGARVVDVQSYFAGRGLELTHIAAEDIHTNDEGHRAIADAFLDELGY